VVGAVRRFGDSGRVLVIMQAEVSTPLSGASPV
jgi:hypothetical protein